MPDASRRRAYATTGVGAGLVATGGMAREHTIRSAERLTGAKRKSWRPPSSVLLRHNSGIGLRRAGWVGGSLMGIAGGTGTVVGLHELAQRRRDAEPDELAKIGRAHV